MKMTEAPVNRTTNAAGKKFSGRLNTAKLGSFMQTLIRNYNNPDLATLREWVSNAHDSHVQAGQTRPIRVTLPTRLAPALTVEDWGIGMSYDDVENTYAVMLTSTKDLDNDGIGGFGIGGKSALAIADQYTMVTIKDGLKNIFIFERSDEGGLEVSNALENAPTDEPNGVKVTVAVSDSRMFSKENLTNVLGGWKKEELELVGGEWNSIYDGTIEFPNGFVEAKSFSNEAVDHYGNRNYLQIMVGPVMYPITNRAHHSLGEKFRNIHNALQGRVVLKLPIGSVTVPSSREVIEDTDANAEVIIKHVQQLTAQIQAHVDGIVANLSSVEDAYKFSTSTFAQQSRLAVTYEGRDLTSVKYAYRNLFDVQVINKRDYDRKSGQYIESSRFQLNAPVNKETEILGSDVDIVVFVEKADNDFSVDTYRKYLRSHVEVWLADDKNKNRRRNRRNYYGNSNPTIIITDKKDPLMEVTSTVWNYSDLRKTAVVPKKSSVKLSDQQRRARVNELVAYQYSESGVERHSTVAELSLEPKDTQVVLIQSTGVQHYVVAFRALFGLGDELVVLQNKKSFESFKRFFTKAVLVDEFLENLSTKKKLAAHKLLDKAREVSGSVSLDSSALMTIETLKAEGLLEQEAIDFLYSPEVRLIAPFSSLWSRPTNNVSTVNYEAFIKFVHPGQRPITSYRKMTGPFSLATSWRGEIDNRELAEYLNWSAKRRLSSTKV